nr:glycosyl hydrolase [Thermoanaerobaculia bacterium]
KLEALAAPQSFEAVPLGNATLPAKDRAEVLAFQQKTARLERAVMGAVRVLGETKERLDHLKKALLDTPGAAPELGNRVREFTTRLADLEIKLTGDSTLGSHNEPTPPAIVDRVQGVIGGHWGTTSGPTSTHRKAYQLAAQDFAPVLEALRQLSQVDLGRLEADAEAAGAPWTPGRFPPWKPE